MLGTVLAKPLVRRTPSIMLQLFEPAFVRYITYPIPLFHYYKGEEGQ